MVALSVIVPVYNTEKYLRECLDSVINQTLKDIEIICINDGSTDRSLDILKEYALKDNRIKVINQENKGQSIARNVGLNIASGKYITFIDSDDYLDLNTYDTVLSNIENIDIVCFGAKVFGNENTKQKLSDDKYYQIKYDGVIELNDEIRFETDCSVCNKIFKRDILKKYSINFPVGIHYEDAEFYFKYINVVNKARYINQYFYHYRRRNDSIMSNTFNGCAFAIEHLYIVDNLYNFLQKNSLFNLREDLFARIFTAYFYCAYYRSPDKYKEKVFALAKEYANKFAISSKSSTFTINVLKKGKEKDLTKTHLNFLERIFSIKNDIRGTHKIFTVLGISLKAKRKKYNNISSKVSVIIPVYNVEKYLRECLDSVINQTLKDIEIICVNDGSTDNSLEILREYEKQDSRIKIIDKKNEGAGAARNLGLKSAHGEYIIFFDSDDYMDITALEKLYQNITDTNADISICKSYEFYDGDEEKYVTEYAIKNNLLDNKTVFSPQEVSKYIFQFCVGWPWDKLYRREFVLKNGLTFQNLHHSNDTRFVLLSLACADKISITEDCLVNHRRHKSSLAETRTNNPGSYYHALISLMKNLKQKNLYKLYEQSFVNYCITFPLWHITSINNDYARSIMEKYLNKLLKKKVKINNYNENYFYDQKAYSQTLEILKSLSIKNKIKQIFSVRNDDRKTHKIITILGMKFKFKKRRSNAKG